jgi:hypothetical protein
MAALTPEAIQGNKLLVKVLEEGLAGDLESKESVYETLYSLQKGNVAGHLVEAAREAPVRQSEEAREAKREAFVGSAATTTPDAVPETEAERMHRVFREQNPRLRDGWEGRDGRARLGR